MYPIRTILGVVLILSLGACADRDRTRDTGAVDDENARTGVDTIVERREMADTTVIRADTSIDVDTLRRTDNLEDSAP